MKIALVGCGWLGSALGFAVKAAFKDAEVVGHDKDPDAAKNAEQIKAIDKTNWNLPATCEDAALVFLAIPQNEVETTLHAIGKYLAENTIVVDASGAALGPLNGAARLLPANVSYINCDISINPLASDDPPGKETFKGAVWFIAPRHGTPIDSINTLAALADSAQAHTVFMDAAEHDGLRLSVDAIPSAVLAAYMAAVSGDEAWRERTWLAGASFAKTTKAVEDVHPPSIASALIEQKEASVHWLNQVMLGLMALRDAVSVGNAKAAEELIALAGERRADWLNAWQKGRDAKPATPATAVSRPSILGMFMGQKLAKQIDPEKSKK